MLHSPSEPDRALVRRHTNSSTDHFRLARIASSPDALPLGHTTTNFISLCTDRKPTPCLPSRDWHAIFPHRPAWGGAGSAPYRLWYEAFDGTWTSKCPRRCRAVSAPCGLGATIEAASALEGRLVAAAIGSTRPRHDCARLAAHAEEALAPPNVQISSWWFSRCRGADERA